MYIGLFCLLRLVLRRQAGSVGMTDILLLVLLADAAQNAMAASYQSLPDGLVLVSTLILWNFILEWLGFHFSVVERFIHPKPLILIKNGRMIAKNMRKELITRDDLMTRLREDGIERISDVKRACLEGNGKISIVKRD
jgi:uncharacterized membrane protein YcaP (DUF421 family)